MVKSLWQEQITVLAQVMDHFTFDKLCCEIQSRKPSMLEFVWKGGGENNPLSCSYGDCGLARWPRVTLGMPDAGSCVNKALTSDSVSGGHNDKDGICYRNQQKTNCVSRAETDGKQTTALLKSLHRTGCRVSLSNFHTIPTTGPVSQVDMIIQQLSNCHSSN